MRCKAVEGRLVAFLREELGADEALELSAHLSQCPSCRKQLEVASALRAPLASLPLRPLSDDQRAALRERTLASLASAPPAARAPSWPRYFAVAGLASAAAAVFFLWTLRPARPAPQAAPALAQAAPECAASGFAVGCRTEAGAQGIRLEMPGVAGVWLEPGSAVELAQAAPATRLRLEKGRALARVLPRKAGASFEVEAGAVRAVVHGTVFAVARRGAEVQVSLHEGAVTVSAPSGTRELKPGTRAVVGAAALEILPVERAAAEADYGRLSLALAPPAAAAPAPTPAEPAAAPSPVQFYQRAEAARRSGRFGQAETAYQEILRRFPGTDAASIAALALGELHLGPLKNPAAALRDYEAALSFKSPTAAEEALAGKAQALSALGRAGDAKAAARAYLKVHPDGIHAEQMRALAR